MERVFLDANVFLQAAGSRHGLRGPRRGLLGRLAGGGARRRHEHRGDPGDPLRPEPARGVVALFPHLLPVTREVMALAADLAEAWPQAPVRDAVHVATMHTHDVASVISADGHFDLFEGIRRIDPVEAARR